MPEGSRLLCISGEVGVLPDGTVPQGIEAQAEACWRNIIAILADAGMGVGRPGSASTIVKALVMPEWLIEIEAVAAAKA
jgi:enamine deaminase RidA (YjgF/YER057c/UK114 family)